MDVPHYLLPRPPMALTPALCSAFEALFAAAGPGQFLDYQLPVPKWQFLCYLADSKEIVLHGSGNPDIVEFEPRPCQDVNPFGAQRAVYAAGDGIWPLYYAILDRPRYPMSLVNSCVRLLDDAGRPGDPYYFFSISRTALRRRPWRPGVVYLLPRNTFIQDPQEEARGYRFRIPHWASLVPVRPLAKLRVEPDDFPFLADIRGHDDETLRARALADPDGFPWLDGDKG